MPSKRDVVSLLKREELLAVVDRFGLEPPDRRGEERTEKLLNQAEALWKDWPVGA